jgi:dihydroorotate dehydrogenase
VIYQKLIRPVLFQLDPERAHALTVQALRITGAFPPLNGLVRVILGAHSHKQAPVQAFGLKFPNPIGLAAGYDKDGLAWRGLAALGFGHIEIGTVTPQPQVGNPRPRIFRIPEENALINRMGFPGGGANYVAKNIKRSKAERSGIILGVNIGKNKDTSNEDAARDYLSLLEKFYPLADYVVVNVSSPNTVGLRRLQAREFLEDLLGQLREGRAGGKGRRTGDRGEGVGDGGERGVAILVKIAPDLTDEELDDALDAVIRTGMDGIIATNTTVSRENLVSGVGREAGGLSGAPLTDVSREMVSKIYQRTGGNLPIIGVGGIMTPEDAKAMLDAGASLVQVYTGLVYAGPGLVREILDSL